MRRLERINSTNEALLAALQGWQSGIWTALPAIVQSFDPVAGTVTAVPSIQAQFLQQDGSWKWVTMPLLADVPVIFPSGGGFTWTFPIAQNDECLVVFSSRCIDDWWQTGQIGLQPELRMHDLSDGFAIVGPRSKPKALSGVSTTSVVLRDNAGNMKIEMTPTTININATTAVNVTAPAITLGSTVKKLVNELFQTLFNNHVHSLSPGTTGTPTTTLDASMLTSKVQGE